MQSTLKLFRPTGGSLLTVVALFTLSVSTVALAQTAEVSQSSSVAAVVIPQQVKYAGALPSHAGETVEVVFKIYSGAEGGEALWTETQRVAVGRDGTYSVLLGAASENGLPQGVFAAGQARWLGVTVDRAEGVRAPLSSVAYAMKAGDAETVGGLAAASIATKDDLAKLASASAVQPQIQAADTPTGSGTADYVPLWTSSGTLGNSGLYQAASGFFGIGTTTPGGPLQLATAASGGANATMMLTQTNAAAGNYYANIGLYNSHGLIGNLSALGAGYPSGNLFVANDVVFLGGQQNAGTNLIFLTNTSGALKFGTGGFAPANERMRIGAAGGVSVGNSYVGTDPGAGNLIVSGNVGVGTAAPAANLEVNGTAKFDGLVTFASGQTFPGGGGSGTITGVTAASPLTGGGTSGTVTVGLNTTTLETTLNGVYARLGAANTFTYAPTFDAGLVAKVNFGSGNYGVLSYGTNGSGGFYGSSDTGYGVYGISTSGVGVSGTSTSGNAGYFSSAVVAQATVYATNSASVTGGGYNPTAVNGTSTGAGSIGVSGSGELLGILGLSSGSGSIAVNGVTSNGYAGYFSNESSTYPALYATNGATGSASANPAAIQGLSKGDDGTAILADQYGEGGYGLYAHAAGNTDASGINGAGVYSLADHGFGVVGTNTGHSQIYMTYTGDEEVAGVWGDTSSDGNSSYTVAAVAGTADDNDAAFFANTSAKSNTLEVINFYNGGGGPTGLFKVFKASTPNGTCGIGDGDLSCTGQLKTLATTSGDGGRTVETYAMQSPENWMEDFGTGAVEGGVGVVQIDPTFAGTVTQDANYHVFLTPRGDSEGHLYVTNVTANSFEVRESHGGTSSLSFDYRIVAKRRGYEAQRMVDVTDRFNAEQAETKRRMPDIHAAHASKGVRDALMVEHSENVGPAAQGRAAMPMGRPGGGAALGAPAVRPNPVAPSKPVAKPM